MNKLIKIGLLSMSGVYGCPTNDYGVTEVTVATGDCMEGCSRTVSKFDKNLNMFYYSELPIDGKNQYYKGMITRENWCMITQLLGKINFQKLDSINQGADGRDLEIISYMPYRKRIIGFGGSLPDSSDQALEKISEIYKSVRLKPIPTYSFETIVQKPPSPPKYEDVLEEITALKRKLNQ